MSQLVRSAICVFACDPRIEAARKPIAGPSSATTHAALLAGTVEEMRTSRHDVVLAWRGDEARARGLAVRSVIAQRGRGIGERLGHAFGDLALLGYRRCAVVVADCPYLTVSDVELGIERLGDSDVVVFPAFDGGFNAIALDPGRRDDVPWATLPWETRRLQRALGEAVTAAGLGLTELGSFEDIDTADALARLIEREPESMVARLLRRSLADVGRVALDPGRRRTRLLGAPFTAFPPDRTEP